MLFELINAFATFQKIINDALREYFNIFVITYLNNILIYSKTIKKHIKYIQKILTCLIKRNLQLKPKKYAFHKNEIDFLKFIVEKQNIKINFVKLKIVQK